LKQDGSKEHATKRRIGLKSAQQRGAGAMVATGKPYFLPKMYICTRLCRNLRKRYAGQGWRKSKMTIDKVTANNFYQDKGDHTLLNWFLYEYANVLFSSIAESSKLAHYRKKHDESNIAEFCVYFSKRLKMSINDAQIRRTAGVTIDGRYVYEFYPKKSYAQTQALLEVALVAWDEHIQICANCPNACLINPYEPTDMFENLEKTGWPTTDEGL
jgi:hypothetical protein